MAEVVARMARERGGAALAGFAQAYLRRPAPADGARDDDAEALLAEVRGAFELASSRDGAPAGVRAFNPRRGEHGYDAAGSVLETNTQDLPFLVDSITAELHARGLGVARVTHPIVGVRRGGDGRIAAVEHPRAAPRESVMHFELDRHLSPEELADLEDAARAILATVRVVVEDFDGLQAGVDRLAALASEDPGLDDEDAAEIAAFLEWVRTDHFVFLGFRETGRPGLGLLRNRPSGPELLSDPDDPPTDDTVGLTITKTYQFSPVHKREPMNALIAHGAGGEGEARLLGLFTSRAYAEPASTTPILRRKLRRILDGLDLIDGSHDSKAAVSIFDGFPKGELFAGPVEDLQRAVSALLSIQGDEVRLLGRRGRAGRGASLVAALPRDRHSPALRER